MPIDHPKVGPIVPTHRFGHCLFDPGLTGTPCGAPATEHLWIGGQDDPNAWTTYVCAGHCPAATALDPLDWHDVTGACLGSTGRLWYFTGTPGRSWCVDPDDVTVDLAETIQAVPA